MSRKMKSYKEFLHEVWFQSYKDDIAKFGVFDVYKNPSKKELYELWKTNFNSVRAFVLKNDVYAFNETIHNSAFDKLSKDVRGLYDSIPVLIHKKAKGRENVPEIEVTDSSFGGNKERATDIIEKNRWVKNTFGTKVKINNRYENAII